MPRMQKQPLVYLALSPAMAATALGIQPREIAEGIASGALPVFVKGTRRRILCSDIERWVRSWPQKNSTRKERPHAPRKI